jgi:hypothetical protein
MAKVPTPGRLRVTLAGTQLALSLYRTLNLKTVEVSPELGDTPPLVSEASCEAPKQLAAMAGVGPAMNARSSARALSPRATRTEVDIVS